MPEGVFMHKLINKYNNLKKKYPNIAEDMMMMFFEKMEDAAYEALEEYEIEKKYGCHIGTEEMYEKAVDLLEWVGDKGNSARWNVDDIVRLSGIDFAMKEYTDYDYAYVVNMLYSDYCNIFTDSSYYMKMAKNYLEDPDYCGIASERAYNNAKKRIKYDKEEQDE